MDIPRSNSSPEIPISLKVHELLSPAWNHTGDLRNADPIRSSARSPK